MTDQSGQKYCNCQRFVAYFFHLYRTAVLHIYIYIRSVLILCVCPDVCYPLVNNFDSRSIFFLLLPVVVNILPIALYKKGVSGAESSRSVRGLGKGVSGKPYPRLCNTRRPRLEPGIFWSQAVRLYRLYQARPSTLLN